MDKKPSVFITGGNGFIGSELVRFFTGLGNLDISVISRGSNTKDGSIILSDYRNSDWLLKQIAEHDNIVVVHTACHIPECQEEYLDRETLDINKQIDEFVMRVFCNCPTSRFIYLSSIAVLGYGYIHLENVSEDAPLLIKNYYAESKAYGERLVTDTFGEHFITRLSSPYGLNNNRENILQKMVSTALRGEGISLYGRGERTQDFIYIEDICNVLAALIKNRVDPGIYNLASGYPCKMLDLARTVISVFDTQSKIKHIDEPEGYHVKINNEKIKEILDFNFLNVRQGLMRMKAGTKWVIG